MFARAVTVLLSVANLICVSSSIIGGSRCTTNLDCQLNGLCTNGVCVCDAAWKGANCSSLNLQPATRANGFGHLASNRSSWGGGVIRDPKSGKWIMFLSQMNMACGLGTWGTNSRCVLAESDTPSGPYIQTRVVVDSWCHGATPGYDPVSQTWLFNHMGNGQEKRGGCFICSNGTTTSSTKGQCTKGGAGTVDTGSALTSQSPHGPYTAQPKMTNGANCESFFIPNGTLYMACPSGGHTTAPNCNGNNAFLHMSRAATIHDAIEGNYEAMPVRTRLAGTNDPYEAVPTFCFNWEDQNLWVDHRGNFHTLMHAFRGQPCDYPVCDRARNHTFCSAVGGHAFSTNGFDWDVSPVIAYTPTVVSATLSLSSLPPHASHQKYIQ